MSSAIPDTATLEQRAWSGDEVALAELFSMSRARLRRIVDARMDNRPKGRVDPLAVFGQAENKIVREEIPCKPRCSRWNRLIMRSLPCVASKA